MNPNLEKETVFWRMLFVCDVNNVFGLPQPLGGYFRDCSDYVWYCTVYTLRAEQSLSLSQHTNNPSQLAGQTNQAGHILL